VSEEIATVEMLRGRILEWEDCYDRLAGAFDLHMDILDCKAALADLAGSYYDALLGALWDEVQAARALGVWANDRRYWTCGICPACGFGRKLDGSEFHGSGCAIAAYNAAADRVTAHKETPNA
jgi:hypothetical protein